MTFEGFWTRWTGAGPDKGRLFYATDCSKKTSRPRKTICRRKTEKRRQKNGVTEKYEAVCLTEETPS